MGGNSAAWRIGRWTPVLKAPLAKIAGTLESRCPNRFVFDQLMRMAIDAGEAVEPPLTKVAACVKDLVIGPLLLDP